MLVDLDQPGPEVNQRLVGQPDTKRFIKPDCLHLDLVKTEQGTKHEKPKEWPLQLFSESPTHNSHHFLIWLLSSTQQF